MTKQHMGVAPSTFQVVYVLAEYDSSFAPCVFFAAALAGHVALSTCRGQYIGVSQDEWPDPLLQVVFLTGFE